MTSPYRIGVDIGGTFTDFALLDDRSGGIVVHKQLTTPADPSLSVLDGIDQLLAKAGVAIDAVSGIVHGMTLVTNAVLERRGARTGMLVTRGFRDVLDIGMERRYDLFDLRLRFALPVVPRAWRAEIDERLTWEGAVATALDAAQIRAAVADLVSRHAIEAIAICFLNSYVDARHEHAGAAIIKQAFPALYTSCSADIVPFMREYERWTTTTVNAYTQPVLDRYLARIEEGLAARRYAGTFHVMTSSGGVVTNALARRFPVRLIESGPAAGILMTGFLGRLSGETHLLGFDMGGTTAKGSLLANGVPLKRYDVEVARVHDFKAGSGLPLRLPVIDLIEIGAGGGSLAELDERGLVRVGPRSAGADPGPACYARGGTQPTLTDADLTIGCLDPGFFLGGAMRLDPALAAKAIADTIGSPLGMVTARAAWGIHEIINEDCARTFRTHAAELGFDHRQCTMLAFGGAGPTHAARIARKLRIKRVIFPLGAGVFSALGLLVSPLAFETMRSLRQPLATLDGADFDAIFAPLTAEASEVLLAAGVPAADISVMRSLDMRFAGQGHDVEVTPPAAATAAILAELPALFKAAYARRYSPIMPTGGRHAVGHFILPLLMGAFADALPERVIADLGMMNIFNVHGTNRAGSSFTSLFFLAGGWGAMLGHDGAPTLPGPSNMMVVPAEIWENLTNITVEKRALLTDSGGAGAARGGVGQEVRFRNDSGHPLTLAFLGLRTEFPARGFHGGKPGRLREYFINDLPAAPKGRHLLQPGDTFTTFEAGGGGYGDPLTRDRRLVEADLVAGLVSPEAARDIYGLLPT